MKKHTKFNKSIIISSLIILIVVFISLIVLFFFMQKISKNYYELIDNKTKILQIAQHATKESNAVYINLLKLLIIKDSTQQHDIIDDIDSISMRNELFYNQLSKLQNNLNNTEMLNLILQSRTDYKKLYNVYIQLIHNHNYSDAQRIISYDLTNKFMIYQNNIENFTTNNKNSAYSISTDIHDNVKYYSSLLLFVGILPIILVLIILIFLVVKFLLLYDDFKKRNEIMSE